jgi:hypothetical protein
MGKYEKKPIRHVNWRQTLVDGLMSFFVGLVLMVIGKIID